MFDYRVCCLFLFVCIGCILGADESVSDVPGEERASLPNSFEAVCRQNAEFYPNVRITSVMLMGAEHNRRMYISINDRSDTIATKDYDSTNQPSDRNLIDAVVKANILKLNVDLCITGNSKQLYGIHLK